jgi:hypothetical protein
VIADIEAKFLGALMPVEDVSLAAGVIPLDQRFGGALGHAQSSCKVAARCNG